MLDEARADKAERQAALIAALTSSPGAGSSAREQLEALLPAETLADLDERVLGLVTGESEPEPEPELPLLDAVAAAHETERQTLVAALLGRRAPAEQNPGRTVGLDGGARRTPPAKPETHAETLMRVLRSGEANAGSRL